MNALLKWPVLSVSEACFQDGLNKCPINIMLFEPQSDEDYAPLNTSTEYKLQLKINHLNFNKVYFFLNLKKNKKD